MPGKYSHGVVLADYSTRGMISLTDEQRKEYAAFAPTPRSKSRAATQGRTKGVRSAQAGSYRPATSSNSSQSAPRRLVIKESSLSLSANFPARNHRPLISTNTFEPPPLPPAQPPPKLNQPPLPPAPAAPAQQPAGHAAASRRSLPPPPPQIASRVPQQDGRSTSSRHSSTEEVGELPDLNVQPRKRFSRSYESLRRYARELQERTTIPSDDAYSTRLPEKSSRASCDGTEPPPYVKHVKPETPPPPISPEAKADPSRPLSATTVTTRTSAPPVARPHSIEPNFDDFVDDFVNALDDFESERGDTTPSTKQSHENGTSQRTPTRDNFEHDAFLEMALPSKSRPRQMSHERDIPSRATVTTSTSTNSVFESQPARTNSSVSSLRSLSNLTAPATAAAPLANHKATASVDITTSSTTQPAARKSTLSPRARSPVPHIDPPWLLPEIREDDKDFTPSIFEDREAIYLDNQASNSTKFPASKVGQISSSHTATISTSSSTTNRDARIDTERKANKARNGSDTSAAFPPPITRFKDDEAEFNANMTKMFGEGVVGGGGGGGGGGSNNRSNSNEKKNNIGARKGLFSRFTRKN